MSRKQWKVKSIFLGGVGAVLLAFAGVALVITIYAFKLGLEARGAPDRDRISDFVNGVAPVLGPVLAFSFTFIAAWWVARKAAMARQAHGILVGTVAAAFEIVIALGTGRGFSFTTVLSVVLVLAAGWLGGRLAGRGTREAPPPAES